MRPAIAKPHALRLLLLCCASGCIWALASGCGDDRGGSENQIIYNAPVQSRAMWVLEPTTIGIGDIATLEVAVVTRPNHRVRPFATPKEVPGLWVLEVETLPVAREPNRWIHRTRVRVRPREVGQFEWPSTPIEVESDGVTETLVAAGLTLNVVSVIPQYIGKLTPFGLDPLEEITTGYRWIWAAGGASFTLGCLALIWLARRESSRPKTNEPPALAGPPPWAAALDELDAAMDQAERDPVIACESASAALRGYMDVRFGRSATTQTIARTTEELEFTTPPFAATTRWPTFVALLQRLDQFRFPAPADFSSERARAREIIADVATFVRDTIPVSVAK